MFVLSIHQKSGLVPLFFRTFAPRFDESGLCAIGTLTTHNNTNAMAYADNCVVRGWFRDACRPLYLSARVILSEAKGFHQPQG